jgi:hypothetical protein
MNKKACEVKLKVESSKLKEYYCWKYSGVYTTLSYMLE